MNNLKDEINSMERKSLFKEREIENNEKVYSTMFGAFTDDAPLAGFILAALILYPAYLVLSFCWELL